MANLSQMKRLIVLFSITVLSVQAQVSSVVLECKDGLPCLSEMKDATVHVIIKDFCDDSKPYKKVLQEKWKYSKLAFDYSEKYDAVNDFGSKIFTKGEWYMYIERFNDSKCSADTVNRMLSISSSGRVSSSVSYVHTRLSIGKAVVDRNIKVVSVIEIPLFPAPGKVVGIGVGFPFSSFTQKPDISQGFFNLGNEFYFENILHILDQFIDNKIDHFTKYNTTLLNCESLKEIVSSTLYVPQYMLLNSSGYFKSIVYVDSSKYFQGYKSKYKILTNEEMVEKFKSKNPFYYLLWAAEGGTKYYFVIEGSTGKIMAVHYSHCTTVSNYDIEKTDMANFYNDFLTGNKSCK